MRRFANDGRGSVWIVGAVELNYRSRSLDQRQLTQLTEARIAGARSLIVGMLSPGLDRQERPALTGFQFDRRSRIGDGLSEA